MTTTEGQTSTELFQADLDNIALKFKENVKLEDRMFRLKTYKQVFVGTDAVDYLIKSGAASSREDAVELGKALQQAGLFEHVFRDHGFEDEYLFYRMLEGNERGTHTIDESTGQKIKWSKFLGGDTTKTVIPGQPSFPKPDFEALDPKDVHAVSHVWPLDEHNTKLLDHVHPPAWKDPDNGAPTYDMICIGAGVGGLVTAASAAGVGARVAMIEENLLGGDCLNVGCVPSKAIIHSANLAHTVKGDMKKLEAAGIFVDPNAVNVDFDKVMERVRKIRADISHHDSAERFRDLGVEVYIGRAVFASERSIMVNGKILNFKKAVIATGGYPTLIPMKGLKELHQKSFSDDKVKPIVMTNETFFNMTKQPKRLGVIGAGVIGLELAQAMQRLGSQVTVFGRSGKVLPKEDEDMAAIVKEQMIKDGVKFALDVKEYKAIELNGAVLDNGYPEMKMTVIEKGADSTKKEYEFDALLVAAGRRPNVTGMELELANVEYDTKRGLIVNDKLQTTNPRVFGVGDCCSQFKFTHAADFMARTVIRNALFFGKGKMSDLLIPYATFTSPEIASVGLYGRDLEELGIEYRVFEKHFKDNDRAICDDATEGFIRFRVDAKTDAILGCSVVGEGAGNMIGEVTLAMESGTGMGAMANVIHPYPTTSEVVRQAGDVYNKTKLTNTVKSLLRGIVKIQK
eukprot:CAMPEP_0116135326 /NCGR_PEP_ID=MMETSP0329-20121206/11131_1 /TAXON_ID=697910 /ORGANISM="Pseudo-nitzschia arenysensis, Strain B593" /LENGTH=683 /DNA_ID=CAMNT_0003630119 /DNA_START=68 /DNA_END=2119 /DNA_ORIENTATION=+